MSPNLRQLEHLRRDANQYILGVLWLTTTAILLLDGASVAEALRALDSLVATLPHLSIPSFALGLSISVAGVALPYCLAAAFTPLGELVLNLTLRLHRRMKPRDLRLARHASKLLMDELKTPFVPPAASWTTYLRIRSPQVAEVLARMRASLMFTAASLVPASVILGWIAFHGLNRILPRAYCFFGALLCSALVFVIGAISCNRTLFRINQHVEMATAMAAKRQLMRDSEAT